MTELRRFILDPAFDPNLTRLGTIVNRLIDMSNGNATGRMWLLGDDGDRQEILGGDVIDSNNYPLRVEPGSTNQLNIFHSNGATIGLRVQDTGLTTGVPASLTSTLAVTGATTLSSTLAVTGATTLSSTLAVTGATTLSSTLAVTGATTLSSTLAVTGATTLTGALTANGAVTLGDAAGDVITVTGTMTVTPLATFTTGVAIGATPSTVGAIRLTNGGQINWRDNANSADVLGLRVAGAANNMTLGDTATVGTLSMAGSVGFSLFVASNVEISATTSGVALGRSGGKIGVFAKTPATQQTGGAATADLTYSSNERDMIQTMWDALRTYGWLT